MGHKHDGGHRINYIYSKIDNLFLFIRTFHLEITKTTSIFTIITVSFLNTTQVNEGFIW